MPEHHHALTAPSSSPQDQPAHPAGVRSGSAGPSPAGCGETRTPDPPGGHPPLPNRGGETTEDASGKCPVWVLNRDQVESITGQLDYLTATAASRDWSAVDSYTATDHPEQMFQKGFKQSENRPCGSAYCRRSWDPHQSSGDWGTEYESWRFPGDTLYPEIIAHLVGVHGSRASRCDIAIDVQGVDVPLREIGERIKRRQPDLKVRLEDTYGDGDTLYLGSRKSPLFCRIYNKGLEQIASLGFDPARCIPITPHYRFELEAKEAQAVVLWDAYRREPVEAAKMAAGVFLARGVDLGVEPIDLVVPSEDRPEFLATLWQAFQQYGPVLVAAHLAGANLGELAEAAMSGPKSRTTAWRHGKRRKEAKEIGAEEITSVFRAMAERQAFGGEVDTALGVEVPPQVGDSARRLLDVA